MLSAAQSKHLCRTVDKPSNEAVEMLRLRCAPLSMTDVFLILLNLGISL